MGKSQRVHKGNMVYRHVYKSEKYVAHIKCHLNLTETKALPTKKSIAANLHRRTKSSGWNNQTTERRTAKKRNLSGSDIAPFVRENNLHTYI